MDFGEALQALKDGRRVAREGWNGRGMFVVLQKGYPDGIAINGNTAEATGLPEGTVCRFRPYLMMYTVDGDFVPWVASQTDLLAADWSAVDGVGQAELPRSLSEEERTEVESRLKQRRSGVPLRRTWSGE